MQCERFECLEVCKDGTKLLVKNSCERPLFVIRLYGEYYYTVTAPDGKTFRRIGKETFLERTEMRPDQVEIFQMEVEPVGAGGAIMVNDEVKEFEIRF